MDIPCHTVPTEPSSTSKTSSCGTRLYLPNVSIMSTLIPFQARTIFVVEARSQGGGSCPSPHFHRQRKYNYLYYCLCSILHHISLCLPFSLKHSAQVLSTFVSHCRKTLRSNFPGLFRVVRLPAALHFPRRNVHNIMLLFAFLRIPLLAWGRGFSLPDSWCETRGKRCCFRGEEKSKQSFSTLHCHSGSAGLSDIY